MRTAILLSAALVAATALLSLSAPAEEDAPSPKTVMVIVAGKVTTGEMVLPATDTEFFIKCEGTVVGFKWEQLDTHERRRVQKLYGIESEPVRKPFGREMPGTRFYLKGGKLVEGLALPQRDRPGEKALKTATVPVMYLSERDIERQETFKGRESDFYSALEVYDRLMLENPPGINDVAAHLAMARRAEEMELYDKALLHVDCAGLIDPRAAERQKEYREALARRHTEKSATDLFNGLLRDLRNKDFFAALDKLDRLDRTFPNSELRSRWEAMRPKIEEGCKGDLARQVIQMAYYVEEDLLRKRAQSKAKIDAKGNLVPSVPGKQIITRHGQIYRGVLESMNPDGDTVLRMGDTLLHLPSRDVSFTTDIDLSVGAKEMQRTFQDLKDYIYELARPDGLKAQVTARIAMVLKVQESKVKEIFDGRMRKDALYADGTVNLGPTYTTIHTAFYGLGSWLRDGAKFMPGPAAKTTSQPKSYQLQQDENGEWTMAENNGNNTAVADVEEDPEKTDDPEVWWKHQTSETQLSILRAIAAERIFHTRTVEYEACKECGGEGTLKVVYLDGTIIRKRCPSCRGMKQLTKVLYE